VPSPAEVALALRHRAQRGAGAGIPAPLAAVPDAELISTLVAHGQPRWSAQLLMRDPALRLAALRFWVDVGDAGRGDKRAKERVDHIRDSFARLRKLEQISDDPRAGPARDHMVDPAGLLS
jgi:hypothetical protein